MWSVHVVPNNGNSCMALEEQYQTHVMVRKKNARGYLSCQVLLKQNKLFSDHFFFQAVVFVYF